MSDFHKPTYTFPAGLYNSTQVRLYGIPTGYQIGAPDKPITYNIGNVTVTIAPLNPHSDRERDRANRQKKADIDFATLDPTRVDLWPVRPGYGFRLPIPWPFPIGYQIPIDIKSRGIAFLATSIYIDDAFDDRPLSPGIIFGYAYEGHCYDLPKPKIMLLPAFPESIPDDDCGYHEKEGEGYRLWIVDKLDQCVEVEVNQGFVEQLVLEANLPGRRSPSTYRATMALAHRGGRLTE